jgi:hypothetical protein
VHPAVRPKLRILAGLSLRDQLLRVPRQEARQQGSQRYCREAQATPRQAPLVEEEGSSARGRRKEHDHESGEARRRVEEEADRRDDGGGEILPAEGEENGQEQDRLREGPRMAAAEAQDFPGNEKEGGRDPRGGSPLCVCAHNPEDQPDGEGLEHERQDLSERDRVDDVAREPVEQAKTFGLIAGVDERIGKRILE